MKLSNRVLEMEESVTLAAGARAKALKAEGRDILSLTLGEPDFTTPKNIQDAAIASIQDGRASFYTVTSGLPELKAAVNTYFERFYGYSVEPNQVTVAAGAKYSLYTFFMAVVNPGDEVIIPTPYWVSYGDQVKMAEGVPVFVPAKEDNHFKVTVEQLEAARTDKTKVLVLNSPSNPTGMIYTREELLAIGNWAVENDILILADDIYGRLVYRHFKMIVFLSLDKDWHTTSHFNLISIADPVRSRNDDLISRINHSHKESVERELGTCSKGDFVSCYRITIITFKIGIDCCF